MTRKLLCAAAALACAGAAAGCGGGDDDDPAKTTTTPPLTKARFIDRADKICQASTAQLKAAGVKLTAAAKQTGRLPQEQVVTFLQDTSVPIYERMLERLRALRPPPDDAADLDGYLASLAKGIDAVKADPTTYAKTTAPDPFEDSNARARRYGLEVCGS